MPAKIYDLRQMPDDIKAAFKARGVDPEDTLIVDDPESNKTEFRSVKELGGSLGKTVGINAAKAILPTLGGAASGAAAMAGVAAMGVPMTGPAGFVPAVASGVGGAVLGGGATSALQESVLDKFAPGMQTEAELLRRANPRSATIGQILGGFAGGMNSLKGLVSRAGGVKEAAKIASAPTALGAGLEAYNEYRDEGQIDPLRVGLTAAAGPFQAVNTKAGQLAEDIGSSLVGKLSGKIADGAPIVKPRSRADISADILAEHAAGNFKEGSPAYNRLAAELKQPGAPVEALLQVAQKHAEQNIQNNPEERAKIADMLWESISVKKLPDEQLPQSALELKLASFIKDGVVNSKEELVGLARQSNLDIAANNLKREKAKAAGPAPSTPYTRIIRKAVEWFAPGLKGVDSPDTRMSGIGGRIVGTALDKTVGRLNDLIFEGTIGPRKVWAGTKSVIDRLRDLGPSGKIIADTDLAMRRDATKVFNTAAAAYVDAYSSLNKKETSRVDQYLNDTFDTKGHSFIILTPKEQAAVDKIRNDGLLYLVDNGIIRGGPGVREGGMYREQRIDPYYIPTVADSKIRKIVKNREKGYEQLAADWEAWYSGKLGMSADDAKNLMQQYLTATGPSSANDAAKFGALTQAEGVGLPPSWRAPTRKALLYHAYRASKNFAWFTHVQKNPAMAKAVGETDDGWGGQIDFSGITNDSIAAAPAVEAWKQEMNNHLSSPGDWTEDLTRIATAFQLGPLTGLRDIIGTPAHMVELIPEEDLPKVMQALYKVVTSDVRGKMESAGDIKAKTLQPFEFNASTFSEGVLDRVLEVTRTLNGRNLLESTARQWAYETGRLVGAARLSKGDTAFFEHLKIPNWRELAPEDLFNATGRAFMDSAQGSYNSRGLPDWLLTGPQNKANNFLFSLQRWGVERYNNWHKNAWQPAVKEGDFKPLLRSVFGAMLTSAGLNALQEYLFNQKPPEMKWSEFMKADNKELPYTLFSKLQNVGFAGILSSLGMAAAKVNSGEVPEPVNNLGWDLVLKGSIRTGQFAHALTSRGADAADVFTDYLDSMARDNIQAWRLWQNRTRPDIGNREEKIFKRQTGKPAGMSASMSSLLANPMDPTRDFRQATTEEDMQKALPGLDRALAMDPSKDIRIQSPMRPLNESPSYYDFVGKLQGQEAGAAALQRDQQLDRLSLLKRQEVMRAKYRAQTVAGPR